MRRPLSVTIVSCIYIAVGLIGLVYHLSDFKMPHPFGNDVVWVSLVRVLAIVAGVFMLRGCNWARWLAVGWMAFHVVLSFFHSLPQAAMHAVLLGVFGYLLFRRGTGEYFARRGEERR